MAYQITLTDDEYVALKTAAEQRKSTIEMLVHEALAEQFETAQEGGKTPKQIQDADPLAEYMYRAGHLHELPTGEPESPSAEAELEMLAQSVSSGMSASEMVIEDRGPR
ncbi:MAG: CopG family transcriptional regulator [Ktedonobacterales bacterium]